MLLANSATFTGCTTSTTTDATYRYYAITAATGGTVTVS
jgi:hypothetical protein